MKNWLGRVGTICVVGFAFGVGLLYAGTNQAMADIKCKLVQKGTGKGVPAEFSARVKDTFDKLVVCTDTTGNGCTIKVTDSNAVYEVRCFPWNTEFNLPDTTISQISTHHHAPLVENRLLIVKGNGEANFTCTDHVQGIGTYADLK